MQEVGATAVEDLRRRRLALKTVRKRSSLAPSRR